MNPIPDGVLEEANEAAIYNLYLYLADMIPTEENTSLRSLVDNLEKNYQKYGRRMWNLKDVYRLQILLRAIDSSQFLGNSRIGDLTVSRQGLTACTFKNQEGKIFVVFKGTGKGEWIDNGEGLSGIPEENAYKIYGDKGIELSQKVIMLDHATDQQVQALDWFYATASKNGWTKKDRIVLSGHSKGGNKAQFIAIHTDLVQRCYSFAGHGFSPEALAAFQMRHGEKFSLRRQGIFSFSADNDYINVLGDRLVPADQIFYFKSLMGEHAPEAMLNAKGRFHPQCEQGPLSRYVEGVSRRLMRMEPHIRKYAALGVMNIFQKILGEGTPVNGDNVSVEQTVLGLGIAIDLFLQQLRKSGRGE